MTDGSASRATLSDKQVEAIREVAAIAAAQTGNALGRLSRLPVGITSSEVLTLKLEEIPSLFGGLNAPAIGVLVPFQGDLEGNALLLFPEAGVEALEEVLLGRDRDGDEDLKLSAFAEIGNILTGNLLTVLSSLSDRILISLPPCPVQDMAGAILDAVLADIGSATDEVTVLVFNLAASSGGSLVRSVFLPGDAGIELLLEAAGRLESGS
ncbi:MAG: chemotaxis protein CheC [bacterium]|nr:chemotaxis protein CheC [bacterium]MDT8396019.1 chemotaxis protein CheC [bacterium]